MNNGFIKRRWILLITGILLLLTLLLSDLSDAHAATWAQMRGGTGIPATGTRIYLRSADAIATGKNGGMVKPYTTAAGATGKALYVKIPDRTKTTTFKNFGTIVYKKTGKIFGKYVDVTVNFTSMTVYPEANPSLQNSDKTMTVARMLYNNLYVSSTDSDGDSGMFYRGRKDIQTTVTITWNEGGGVVNLPFYVGVADIDATGSYFQESWIGGSGFDGTIYTWQENNRVLDKANNRMTAPQNGSTSGNDSWYKAGLIATTSKGNMSMTWVQGNCGAEIQLYSQYQEMPAPTKTVDKTSAVKGDTITWTVNQKVGTFYNNMFNTYSSFSLSDPIPQGVEYQSARVYSGSEDITAKGTLSYHQSSRLLTFTLGSGTLGNVDFYKGQTISMRITAKALLPQEVSKTVQNTASAVISGYSQNTNTVTTVIRRPDLTITKKAGKATYQSYETVPYTVQVKQTTSGLSARNVTISDTLPKQMTLTGKPVLSGVSGTVSVSGNTWTAALDKPLPSRLMGNWKKYGSRRT